MLLIEATTERNKNGKHLWGSVGSRIALPLMIKSLFLLCSKKSGNKQLLVDNIPRTYHLCHK